MKEELTTDRITSLIATMRHYYAENEKLRQHVTGDEWRHNNALGYSAQWADIAAALVELLDRRDDAELLRIIEERKGDKLIPVDLNDL
ncbi:hypothetical protein NRB36_004326 [Salmonella enterica]|nr:hypothetical protein [Salmonella enterica]EJO1639685.1 hypothetical protein [Salmonella enterica]